MSDKLSDKFIADVSTGGFDYSVQGRVRCGWCGRSTECVSDEYDAAGQWHVSDCSFRQEVIYQRLVAGLGEASLMLTFEPSDEDKALLQALPSHISRVTCGPGGIACADEDVEPLVRNLFSMGAMGYSPAAVLHLVRKNIFAAEMRLHARVLGLR